MAGTYRRMVSIHKFFTSSSEGKQLGPERGQAKGQVRNSRTQRAGTKDDDEDDWGRSGRGDRNLHQAHPFHFLRALRATNYSLPGQLWTLRLLDGHDAYIVIEIRFFGKLASIR
jgi:hypothetical protein